MKNHFHLLFSMWLFISFFQGSCKDSGKEEVSDFHLTNADSILSQFNSKREPKDWIVKTEGKVNIKVEDKIVYLEHSPENGEVFMTYFFQSFNEAHDLKSDSFGRAEILFLKRNLIINSLERNQTLLFSLMEDAPPVYLADLQTTKKYIGFGLGLRKINKGSTSEYVPLCGCEPNGSPYDHCVSGGDGALSCGTGNLDGSCEVSCAGENFACCNKKME